METFKRLSTSFSSQIKELSAKVSSKDGKDKTALPSDSKGTPCYYFSSGLLNATDAGEVLCESRGQFYDFVVEVENATIHHLLGFLSVEDLPQAASIFIARAAQCGGFDLTDSAYCSSQIGIIRSCIRIIASNDPVRLFDHLDAIFLDISISSDMKISDMLETLLRGQARSISVLAAEATQISCLLLQDEPLTSTLQLKSQLSHSASVEKTNISVSVKSAGSEQVHGLYCLVVDPLIVHNNPSSADLTYSNLDGYMIRRRQKVIRLVNDTALKQNDTLGEGLFLSDLTDISDSKSFNENSSRCSERDDDSSIALDFTIYQWLLSNPSVASHYYCCNTLNPSSLPPQLGWRLSRPFSQGRLPGPQLTVVSTTCNDSHVAGDDNLDYPVDELQAVTDPTKDKGTNMTKNEIFSEVTQSSQSYPLDTLQGNTKIRNKRIVKNLNRRVVDIDEIQVVSNLPNRVKKMTVEVDDASCASNSFNMITAVQSNGDSDNFSSRSISVNSNVENFMCVNQPCEEDQLLALIERCRVAEISQKKKVDIIADRLAWLSAVVDTDELISGFTLCIGQQDEIEEKGDEMGAFQNYWGLSQVVLRAQALTVDSDQLVALNSQNTNGANFKSEGNRRDVTVSKVTATPIQSLIHTSVSTSWLEGEQGQQLATEALTKIAGVAVDCFGSLSGNKAQAHILHSSPNSVARQVIESSSNIVKNHNGRNGIYSQFPDTEKATISEAEVGTCAGMILVGARVAKDGIGDGRRRRSKCLTELLQIATPMHHQCNSYAEVHVMGVEMRGQQVASAATSPEKAFYVIRISLRDGANAGVTAIRPVVIGVGAGTEGGDGNIVAELVKAVGGERSNDYSSSTDSVKSESILKPSSGHSLYLPPEREEDDDLCQASLTEDQPLPGRDMDLYTSVSRPSSPHTKSPSRSVAPPLQKLQPPNSYSRQVFSVKKDLSSLSVFHVQLVDLLLSHLDTDIQPPPFPDPFVLGALEEALTAASASQRRGLLIQSMKEMDIFAYSSTMRRECTNRLTSLQLPGLDTALDDIQQYLTGVFALVETFDEDIIFHQQGQEQDPSDDNTDGIMKQGGRDTLPSKLGRLLGSFLTPTTQLQQGLQPRATDPSGLPTSSSTVSLLSVGEEQGPNSTESPERRSEQSFDKNLLMEGGELVTGTWSGAPCWQPYAMGLRMRLAFNDDRGGRLSLRSDEELLRSQRNRCIGCGERLSSQWGFLGLDRNYQPCRYYGGLFCRKWCHADQKRQIPHRMLLYWDHNAHRVSRQAAQFLDGLWKLPLLNLISVSPLLYEGVPALRLARNMRGRASQLIQRMLQYEPEQESEGLDVKDAVLSVLGAGQLHLCLGEELYSLSDLVGVHSGDLLASLEMLIGILRNKDRTLSVGNDMVVSRPYNPADSPSKKSLRRKVYGVKR